MWWKQLLPRTMWTNNRSSSYFFLVQMWCLELSIFLQDNEQIKLHNSFQYLLSISLFLYEKNKTISSFIIHPTQQESTQALKE